MNKGIIKKIFKNLGIFMTAGAVMLSGFALPAFAAAENEAAAETSSAVYAADETAAKTVAFPGAEGGGMYASGGRGALDSDSTVEVYHVTNLNDSGEGSFRDAVSDGNRIVVFDVSGYIDLESNVNISDSNITVLGQTAPGDGITIRSNNVKVSGKNKVIRYLKFRVGAHDASGNDTRAQDGMEITDNAENIIIDHCSVSWGTDENLSAYAIKNVTIQNCIIAEALNQSVHDKGEHSYAAIWGGVNLSIHHNIIASHKSRNPKVGTSETVAMTAGYTDDQTLVDLKNNIIYNWGDKAGYGSENGAKTYIQNNIYKPGPATPAGKRSRIFELSSGNKYKENYIGSVYATGNKIYVDEGDSDYANAQLVNADNWQDDLNTGVYVPSGIDSLADKTNMKITTPDEQYQEYEAEYPITMTSADEAYESILKNAGANYPKRDKVDERIVSEVETRTAVTGSKGSTGLLDDPIDGIPEGEEASYDSRGYPIIESETRDTDYDTDLDGIPDTWEDKMGLDKSNPNDSTYIGPGGYTYLEIFAEEGISYSEAGDITLAVDGRNVTVTSQSGESVDVYVGSEKIGTAEFAMTAPAGSTVVTAGYNSDGTLAEMQYATQTADGTPEYPELTNSADTVKHFIWDSLDGMQPVGSASGTTATLAIPSSIADPGVYTVTGVGSEDGCYTNMDYLYVYDTEDTRVIEGDFTVVLTLNQIPTVAKNARGGISIDTIGLYAGTDENYSKIVTSGDTVVSMGNAKYLRATLESGKLTTYMSDSLLNWTEIASYDMSQSDPVYITRQKDSAADGSDYATNIAIETYLTKSEPKITVNNIEENQRLGFSETLNVTVVPDGAAVQEIDVLLGRTGTNSATGEQYYYETSLYTSAVNITETETLDIPITFSEPTAGTLRVACVAEDLCVGNDTREITVSGDPSPWILTDIGMSSDMAKTYMQVTDDYTYKMFCPTGGNIGGTSDKFGYMYQQFTGDYRMYFRIRPQSAAQYGVVLRSDLDPDGIAYYFGCDDTSVYKYDLMARTTKGGEMQLISTPVESGADKHFLIIEKKGDTFNVYETNSTSPFYTTEDLICSTDCSLLGDTYYMGMGVTGTNAGDFGDIGWTGIEKISELDDGTKTAEWNFDNGLDWRWQLQEANVLTPSWTEEEVSGNTTGKMKLSTDSDYDARYVLHEYKPSESNMMIDASADVLLSGDEVGMNVYLNAGKTDKAFKVSFTEDGTIAIADVDTGIAYDTQKWYTVSYSIDQGADDSKASIAVKDQSGNVVAENASADLVSFRSQIDSKKTAIANAVFFEPISGKTATYYVDDVSVAQKVSTTISTKVTSWYTFGGISTIDGAFTVDGTTTLTGTQLSGEQISVASGAQLKTGTKTVDGKSFTNRIRIKGSSGKITVPVKDGNEITVYAASANSSTARALIIGGVSTDILSACATSYTYSGDAGTIEISGGDNIEIYGIYVESRN